jgi:polyisoprenyl-teichoic acid--peptidoglycan teichoic acid transferase
VKRRVALALAALCVWVSGAALGSAPGPRAGATPLMALQAAHKAQFLPALTGKKPVFILALGSDARPGQNILRERSDSIHIIGVNPKKHAASILGFPRDSLVPIPGHGTGKINSAMSAGGPALTVKTIESLTGIHIDFFLITSFRGLSNMVSSIGGVTVDVPFPMHDRFSGADFNPGVQRLNGNQALAFARDRHDVPGGDLGRSANQGRLLLAALAEFRRDFRKDPSVVLQWMGAGLRNVETTGLSLQELLKLAFTAQQVDRSNVKNVVVPGRAGSSGGSSVVYISSSAKGIYANMKKDGLIG